MRLGRAVEGEIEASDHDMVVAAIEHEVGGGSTRSMGRSLLWRSRSRGRDLSVTVEAGEGVTAIGIDERLTPLAAALFGGMIGGVGVGVGLSVALGIEIPALSSPLVATLFLVGLFGASYVLARVGYRWTYRRRSAELARLAVSLERRVARLAAADG